MMEAKDKIDALIHMSSIHRSQFDQRRIYEWRVLLSTLTLYAFSVAGILAGDVQLPADPSVRCTVWIVFLVFGGISSIYLSFIHKANRVNKQFAEAAERDLQEMLESERLDAALVGARSGAAWKHWSLFWQLLTVLFFYLVSAYTITSR